jgi:hypothetical protein
MIDSLDQFSVPRYRFPPSPHVSQDACLSVHPVGYVQRLCTPSIPTQSNHPSNRRTLSIIRIQPRNVPRHFRPAQSSRYRFPPSPHASQDACLSVHPVGYVQRLSTPSIPTESNHPSDRRTLSIIRIQPRNVPRRFRPAQSARYRFPPSPHASKEPGNAFISHPDRIPTTHKFAGDAPRLFKPYESSVCQLTRSS